MRRSIMLGVIAVAAMLGVAGPAHASTSCTWSWTDLPAPAGITATVTASDGHGTYVGSGYSASSGREEAVLWQGGTVTSLGAAFGADTTVWDVNSNGVVVGQAGGVPVRYQAGQWEYLPVPSPSTRGAAMYVNDNGDIAGAIGLGSPILWPATGGYQRLTIPIVTNYSEPTGIAQDGTVSLWANDAWYHKTASFLYAPDGTWTRAAAPTPTDGVFMAALNENIGVGNTTPPVEGDWNPAVLEWNRNGTIAHTYPGLSAIDVNTAGQLLGTDTTGLTIWRDGTQEAQLPSTIDGVYVTGVAIDDDGTVLGQRDWADGQAARPVVAHCA